MRKLFVLIAFLVLTSSIYTQEIVDSVKLWSIMSEHCQPWGSSYSTAFFRFDGDTIIGGKDYTKVWFSQDENHSEWYFYGSFIREEDGYVYYKKMYGEEGLIYNFNLELGDSVIIDNPRAPNALTLFLVEIDSIEIENGYRERWKLVSNVYPDDEYWIRGIGSQAGIINSGSQVFGGSCGLYTLLCEKENDILIYQNPEFGSCYLHTTDINNATASDNRYILSFDENKRTINIKMKSAGKKNVIISNISGKICVNEIIDSMYFSFFFGEYPSGVYIATVVDNRKAFSHKFIIQ